MRTSCRNALWLIPKNAPHRLITEKEFIVSQGLPSHRAQEYSHSRGYVREVLSDLFSIDPLEIPLIAPPGKAPKLVKGWGNISFSHCKDALLIGWSTEKIGVDIERTDRKIEAKSIIDRFYSEEEKLAFDSQSGEFLRLNVLKSWLIKEAAIKCQTGSIARDLSEWIVKENYKYALHKSLNIELKTYYYQTKSWSIGIASDSKDYLIKTPICEIFFY